ncbi:MAG: glycogen synthase, partial [Caldiserica bacterium]|nr:glycogen synthase [Caldisericota bacterium]
MRIGIVASEATPFSKTGGLADVSGSLFKVFNKLGNETYLFLPYYKETRSKINDVNKGSKISIKIGGKNIEGRILSKEISKGMNIILIEQNGYFD